MEDKLKLFFPQYFDPAGPDYIAPDLVQLLGEISCEARPPCLSPGMQDLAEAYFLGHLIQMREELKSGQKTIDVAGPVLSEREGDIAVTYADLTRTGAVMSQRPPSNAWDQWHVLWLKCTRGAITSRFGDPVARIRAVSFNERDWAWRCRARWVLANGRS